MLPTPNLLRRTDVAVSALAAALPGTVFGITANPGLLGGELLNPDSAMRLVRLNDMIAAGRPLGAVMRDASGAGNVLPWSHLLDSLLLLLAAPFAPLLGWHAALHLAGLASGPLAMAGLGMAVAWAAAPLADRAWLWLGAFAVGAAPVLLSYGSLGVVHHHVLLVLVPVAMAGCAIRILRGNPGPAIAMGAWAATGLWFSPETLPFAVMAFGALWAPCLLERHASLARPILHASAAFALLATLAWLIDAPTAGLQAIELDRLSLPTVAVAWAALLTAAAALRGTASALAAAATLAAAWLAAFHRVLDGTGGIMTPEQAHAFFGGIAEMAPMSGLDDAVRLLPGGLLALATLLAFARTRPAARTPLLYAAACTAAAMALAAVHIRFAAYPAAAGAVALPASLTAFARLPVAPALQTLARSATLAALLGTPIFLPVPAEAGAKPHADPACPLSGAIALLADHPGDIVLADVNIGPPLLYATPIRIVGSLYHRNPAAFIRLQAALHEPVSAAPGPAFRATAATLVLACPAPRHAPGASLEARLAAAQPPAWLHRLADAGPGGYVLYQAPPPTP